jgi:hypothetical protein
MTEAGPSDAAQPSGEAALAGAASTGAAQPAGLNDEQKQAQLIASERQYQQGVQAIRVTPGSMFVVSQQQLTCGGHWITICTYTKITIRSVAGNTGQPAGGCC